VPLDELTAYLHLHIPLSRRLGAAAGAWDGRALTLEAPLEPNLNHRGTAFGGSLTALAILSGWAALHLALGARAPAAHIVIQRSAMDFDAPVEGFFSAEATLPQGEEWERFLRALSRRGRGRIVVPSEIRCGGRVAGRHQGTYVALGAGG